MPVDSSAAAEQQHAALEAFIEIIGDHRRYHAQLVHDLRDLLASMQTLPRSGTSQDFQATPNTPNMPGLGKQVKRLFNQSLSTLTKWSEIVRTPNSSDVVARETLSTTVTCTTAESSTTDPTTSTSLSTTKQASAVSGVSNRQRSGSVRKALGRENAEDVQERTGLMRGAKKTTATPTTDVRTSRTNRSTNPMQKAVATSEVPPSMTGAGKLVPTPVTTMTTTSTHQATIKKTKNSPIYDTGQPTYAHISVLVDVGFLGVRTLEIMGNTIPTNLFEIEKARSNLISKVIQLGMKKRALQELGYLREQLTDCAISLWNEPDLKTMAGISTIDTRTQLDSKPSQQSSIDSIKNNYQHLFTFPFPKALSGLTENPPLTSDKLDHTLTFTRLVQALHNNTLRCWMDVRNGSLAYLLPEMMSQPNSPYDWCMCVAKLDKQAGQQSLDALFRLLFMSAGKVMEYDRAIVSQRHAFRLRMLGLQYYGAQKYLVGASDGMIWDKVLRCGVEYEKSTRDQQGQNDIRSLVSAYKAMFEFLDNLSTVDQANPRFLEWHKHLDYLVRKLDDTSLQSFVRSIRRDNQDSVITTATAVKPSSTQQATRLMGQRTSTDLSSEGTLNRALLTRSITASAMMSSAISTENILQSLEDAMKSLRNLQDTLHRWYSMSASGSAQSDIEKHTESTLSALVSLEKALPTFPDKDYSSSILLNIARVFRSMDTIRSIGSKVIDKIEKMQRMGVADTTGSMPALLQCLVSAQSTIRILSDITAGLWEKARFDYLALCDSDHGVVPHPTKLSCARVDAILLLFRLNQSRLIDTAQPEPRPILEYLESAFTLAKDMNDSESLPWISNALYNHGGILFKASKKKEAIRPLKAAVECYRHWLGDELSTDTSLDVRESANIKEAKNSKADARLVLANRYEVLGVCFQAVNDLDQALECFNTGLCALPLSAFRDIDSVTMGELKTSQLPAAKLLNRRVRIMLMMEQPYFKSVVTSVTQFESKMARSGVPTYIRGIAQEFECAILSTLSVKSNQATVRTQEQIEIRQHLMNKVYRGGRALVNPIRRARVLIHLAMLYQASMDESTQQEAFHLIEEAIEVLKEKDLKEDADLEPVRNHNLALAYSWYGILDCNRSNGLSRKSKPFQIALQLWELILSDIECFVSHEETELLGRKPIIDKVATRLPDPEFLYDHLQMLADCLGMNDNRVLQVQVYLLMLKLCNGVLPVSDETYADAVGIYSRMGGAYLALGYSGKAKMSLNQGHLILEEMSRRSEGSHKYGNVHATWLLTYSLYLTSVGSKSQGVSTYNQARIYSDYHRPLIGFRKGSTSGLLKNLTLPRKVEAKVFKALGSAEASLTRSQLLLNEGNLSEAIADSKRAGRQLSRVVSTLSVAIKAAREDPGIIRQQPMENPFLEQDGESEGHQRDEQPKEQVSFEMRQLRQGLEMLATQRYQWLIVKLLIEAYHQLGRLYLLQGSAREAQYFIKEGKHIAQLSRAGKSMSRFMLDEAQLELRRHEWSSSQQILQYLIMQEDESNAGALAWELQDARIQLLNGDLFLATRQWDLSLDAYSRTDEVLSHLMDKAFISGLEQLVIREPQTPREAKLVAIDYRQGRVWKDIHHQSGPDQAQYECVMLSGIKAELGYRTSLVYAQNGHLAKSNALIEGSKAGDSMMFMVAEYHHSKAKVLMMELEEAMKKHLMFAMIPDSALSVGLIEKTQTQQLAPPSAQFTQASVSEDLEISTSLRSIRGSILSSPSVRVTRMTRRHRSQLSGESTLQSSLDSRSASVAELMNHYLKLLADAREHLSAAYNHSIRTCPPHVISDICSKQAYLCVLESCFHQGTLIGNSSSHWIMAYRAASYLEMAKAITQHREMHGLIKQKLNPESVQEDSAWPPDICPKDQTQFGQQQLEQTSQGIGEPRRVRHGSKIANYIGLQKPRRLNLDECSDDENQIEDDVEMTEEDTDLKDVGMNLEELKTRQGRREYYNRQSHSHPSTSLSNERPFLEMLDTIYERDCLIMNDQPEAFQRELIDILPEKWTVVSLSMDVEREVLYVNRLRANSMPIVVRLPLNRAQLWEGDDQDVGLHHALGLGFDIHQERELGPPLSYKEALEELQDILSESQKTLSLTSSKEHSGAGGSSEFISNPSDLPREIKAEWWNRRQRLDDRLCILLETMEDQWLCGLKGLIQSHNTPANEENLLEFKRTLEWIISQAANTSSGDRQTNHPQAESLTQLEINIELCRVILHLGDRPSFTVLKDLIYFLLDAFLHKNTTASGSMPVTSLAISTRTRTPIGGYSDVQFGRIASQIKEALQNYWQAETKAKNNGFDDGAHVILVLDKHLQMFPWESCPVLREEAVSRVPSVWFLRDRILQQQRQFASEAEIQSSGIAGTGYYGTPLQSEALAGTRGRTKEAWRDLEVNPQKTFYVLNPAGDLKNTEDEFKGYVESQEGWDGVIGRPPMDMECINGLSRNDLYIYFGHSGGEQYIKSTQIRQLGRCAVSILLGCSSGTLKSEGDFDPTGNAMNYLMAGCPTLVANLWDVTDKDLDRFSMAMFNLWGLEDNRCNSESPEREADMEGADMFLSGAGTRTSHGKLRLSLVEAVKEARDECRLKYLVGAASVVYGIPCFLK